MGLEMYQGGVALVTGASSGIGAAVAQALQKNGLTVVGAARRIEKIQALDQPDATTRLYAYKCDVTKEEQILATFKWVKETFGGVDVLVNNAGLFVEEDVTEADTAGWENQLDVNLLAYNICAREAVKDMTERGVNGYIINICSVTAHLPTVSSSLSMYFATKYAVRVLTDGLRMELRDTKSKIRTSQICPAIVKTEIWEHGGPAYNCESIKPLPYLKPEDIADIVIFMLSRPMRVQIQDVILRATGSVAF